MNTPKLEGICVLVDGGCLNNNKPVSERSMYGSMAVFHNGKRVDFTCTPGPKTHLYSSIYEPIEGYASNNLAELLALVHALDYADGLVERTGRPIEITILTDSEWAMNVMQGNYKVKPSTHSAVRMYADMVKGRFLHSRYGVRHVDNGWVKAQLGH